MDKKQKRALSKSWKIVERSTLLADMPLTAAQLHQLLGYVDSNLVTCDHTTKLTSTFLRTQNLELGRVLGWLGEHGGYCDCEVLANLADLDESLQAPPMASLAGIQPKTKRDARSLKTITGWNLANLPQPWRIANLYDGAEPLRLQLGKKNGCSIRIVESPLPSGDQKSDEFWSRLWYARTDLPPRGSMQVEHPTLSLSEDFHSTLVRSSEWTPVYCWVVPLSNSWHLEICTEWNRYVGDLPQISSLIKHLAIG